MLYELEVRRNATGATKNVVVGYAKDKDLVNHRTKWFKKFCSCYNNRNDQARSGRQGFRSRAPSYGGKFSE